MSQQFKDSLESQVYEDRESTPRPSGSQETITQEDYIPIQRECESVNFLQDEANRRDVTPPPTRRACTGAQLFLHTMIDHDQ